MIVEAVAISVNSKDKQLAKHLENAMTEAVLACARLGITDPVEIKARMMVAHSKAKSEYEGLK
jgi:hypothetical protein